MGGEYEEGPVDLWLVKGEIPSDGLPTLVKLTPLHFTLNTSFRGTDWKDFEMHVKPLSSIHFRDFDITDHQVAAREDEG